MRREHSPPRAGVQPPWSSRGRCGTWRSTARRLRLGRWPALIAATYAALGLSASANDKYEVFPFFSWFLFPVTPNQVTRFELATTATKTRLAEVLSMDLEVLIQDLGHAVVSEDAERIAELRQRLESNFLGRPCRYAVKRHVYDPVAAWQGADAGAPQVIAEYSCPDNP